MAKKSNAGRPTVMTDEVLAKLEDGFLRGYTDLEACLYSDISADALYAYQLLNPEFTKRKQLLKQNIKVVAKNALFTALEGNEQTPGNPDLALKTLERLDKKNWSTRSENQNLNKDGEPADNKLTVEFVSTDKPKDK